MAISAVAIKDLEFHKHQFFARLRW